MMKSATVPHTKNWISALGVVVAAVMLAACELPAGIARDPNSARFADAKNGDPIDVVGTLDVVVEDNDTGGTLHYSIATRDGTRRPIQFAKRPAHLKPGTQVRLSGVLVNDSVHVSDAAAGATVQGLASSGTFGEQSTVVLLVKFTDTVAEPYTIDFARDVIFNQASGYFREASFGQMSLTGDVFGWLTMSISSAGCDNYGIMSAAMQAASAAGINVANYRRRLIAFPKNACGWWGMGTLGSGAGGVVWINGKLERQVVTHEIGHNLGLYHAHSVVCTDGTTGIAGGPNCGRLEYGDSVDNMGYSVGYFGAFAKEQLGWLNYGSSPPITTVSPPGGSFWIDTYESSNANPKALKIARPDGTFYYAEARVASGADSFLAGSPVGLFIRTGTPGLGDTSVLYDMTPTTAWNFTDGALVTGKSFTDATAGITISPSSVGATGASVTVSFAPPDCRQSAPTVTVAPQRPMAPGAPYSAVVTILNNNSSGCAPAVFDFQASAPAGWTAAFDLPSSSAMAGGASSYAVIRGAVPSTATPGVYSVNMSATQQGVSANTATATLPVEVQLASCIAALPAVTLSPAQASVSPGSATTLTMTLTNNNGSTCGVSAFTLGAYAPSGLTATIAGGLSVTASPGGSVSRTIQVSAAASAAASSHTITITASPLGVFYPYGQGSATVVVQASACALSAPTLALSPSQASMSPGGGAALTVTLTNKNGSTCPSATFNLAASAPAGWTATVANPAPNVASGASNATTLQVTAPATATAGTYSISLNASQSGSPTNSASAVATVTISTPTCTVAAPTVSLSPATASIAANGSAAFVVSVTNKNGATCGSSTFTLAPSAPAGWTAVLLTGSSISIAPGATSVGTLLLTAPAAATAGTYSVSVNAAQSGNPGNNASASANAVIAAPYCTQAAPTIAIQPFPATINAGSGGSLLVSITNRNASNCSTSTFNLSASGPAGWSTFLSGPSVVVSPGATNYVSLTLAVPAGTAGGSYTASVRATQSDSASNTGLGSAIINVPGSACALQAPAVSLSPAQASFTAGGSLGLVLVVTNRNSSVCGTGTFDLTASAPSGWTGALTSSSVAVAPGSSVSVGLAVTSPASASANTYQINASATQHDQLSNTGSASASIVISAPTCAQAAPTVTLTALQSSVNPGASASFAVSLTNNNSSSCGASSFSLVPNVPAGWTTSFSGSSTPSVGAGATTSLTMLVTVPTATSAGSYNLSVVASQVGGAGASAVGSGSLTVNSVNSGVVVGLMSDHSTYKRGQHARLTANVTMSGAPVPNVIVYFSAKLPDGRVVQVSKKTDGSGRATANLKIQSSYPVGVYSVTATTSVSGQSATSAPVSFTVR